VSLSISQLRKKKASTSVDEDIGKFSDAGTSIPELIAKAPKNCRRAFQYTQRFQVMPGASNSGRTRPRYQSITDDHMMAEECSASHSESSLSAERRDEFVDASCIGAHSDSLK
jgi:hypothetical protein